MMVSYWLVLLACLLCTSPICAISAASLAANEVFVADPVNFYQALQTDGVDRIVVIRKIQSLETTTLARHALLYSFKHVH